MEPTTVRVLGGGAPQRCSYCHQSLDAGELLDCDHCGGRMHAACVRELRRCATCDAPLGPQLPPELAGPWDEGLPDPPAGRLYLHREGERLIVEWENGSSRELVLVALGSLVLCPLAPAMLLVLPVLLQRRRGRLELGPRELRALVEGGSWGQPREVRLPRRSFRGVQLDPTARRLVLQSDRQAVRLLVAGLTQGCSREELRWLAELLRRWRTAPPGK